MGTYLYKNEIKYARPYISGTRCNAYINGKKIWDDAEEGEFIIHTINTMNIIGGISIFTRGWGSTSQDVLYDWIIEGSLDGKDYELITTVTGSSSETGSIRVNIPFKFRSENMYLRIKPNEEPYYGWARAFNMWNGDLREYRVLTADISSVQKGFRLDGTSNLGNNFLRGVWSTCNSLVSVILPDTSDWDITSIGDNFLRSTWSGCTSLTTAVVPDTSNWRVNTIGSDFLSWTWLSSSGSSLETAVVPDTSNWRVNSIGDMFLNCTWSSCDSLETAVVPDTSKWEVIGSLGDGFLSLTWQGCTSLKTAVVPDTSKWKITGIGNQFLSSTWIGTSLETAVVPDTSGWEVVGSVGNYFLSSTWKETVIKTAVVPDTSKWKITDIGEHFMRATWENCTSLLSAVFPDTSGWNVGTIPHTGFLYTTLFMAFPLSGGGVLTIKDNVSNSVYSGRPAQGPGIDNNRISSIRVPAALLSAFQNTQAWSQVKDKFVPI